MSTIFLIFSHILTDAQKLDLEQNYNVNNYIVLPSNLQKIWSDINPSAGDIREGLEKIYLYVLERHIEGDICLVQGDFGAIYYLVTKLENSGINCYYSTTERISKDVEENGKIMKKSVFKHVRFRRYMI